MDIIPVEQAKRWTEEAGLNMNKIRQNLNEFIEQAARQGLNIVFMVLPKYIPVEEIHGLSAELRELGYQVKFGLEENYYYFNVHWT